MSQKSNRIIGAILLAVLAAGAIAASTMGRGAAVLEQGSPEATVQSFLTATLERDFDAAIGYLEPGTTCTLVAFDRGYIPANADVGLVKSDVTGTTAAVTVKVEIRSGGLLGGSYSETHTYRLAKVASDWRITGIPWPLYDCGTVK